MQILVTDRESIERGFLVRCRYALISIRDPGTRKARGTKSTALRPVLHVAFHDAEPTESMVLPAEVKVMTAAQTRQIWRFVDRHKDTVGAFVVHCHQGMSRSPAVAAAVAKYLGVEDGRLRHEYTPNQHVYRLMRGTMPGGYLATDEHR